MSPQRLDEILKNYRSIQARYAYLRAEIVTLERWLAICQNDMINDEVSMSQAITGMPHGSGVGDPVGRLAVDIASGKVSVFVAQIQEDMKLAREEMLRIGPQVRIVEIVLGALTERERETLEMKIIGDMSWAEVVAEMNKRHNNCYSKRSLQRLLDKAVGKAYEVVR